ncbi:conjugal transfer protein [Serratia sp. S1B]|nr:conjugal transfer protein [Serratia sp. S1B]
MKIKTLLSLFLAASTVITFTSPAIAADACESVLCLYGKATGNSGGSQCSNGEKAFFNILKKKKGSIKWNETFDARKSFLNQCSSADPSAISLIMSKFGKTKG